MLFTKVCVFVDFGVLLVSVSIVEVEFGILVEEGGVLGFSGI